MSSANKWALGVETTQAMAIKQNGTEFGQNYLFHRRNHVGAQDGMANCQKWQKEECFPSPVGSWGHL